MTLKEEFKMTADVHQDQSRVSDNLHHALHEAVQPLDQAARELDAHLQTYPDGGQESAITRQEIGKAYEAVGPAIARYMEHPAVRRADGQEGPLKQLIGMRSEAEMIGRALSRDPTPASATELQLHRENLTEYRQTLSLAAETTRAVVRDGGPISRQSDEDEDEGERLTPRMVVLEVDFEAGDPDESRITRQSDDDSDAGDEPTPTQIARGYEAPPVRGEAETRLASYTAGNTEGTGRGAGEEINLQQTRYTPEAPVRTASRESSRGGLAETVEAQREEIEAEYEAAEAEREAAGQPEIENQGNTQEVQEGPTPISNQETEAPAYVREVSENEVTVGRFGEEANRPYILQQGQNSQGEQSTCGVVSQAMILNELTGSPGTYSEEQLLQEALTRGLYAHGTALPDYGELARLHGMKVEKGESSTEELVQRLAHGEAAQVSVNAGILWNDESAYGNGEHNHAVFITGADIVRNASGELEVKSVWVNDSGNGETYEVSFERFAQAWATSNNYAAYIANPNANRNDSPLS